MKVQELQKVESREEKMEKLAKELVYIMANLRFYGNYWHLYYGSENRDRMKRWEARADEVLAQMGIEGPLKNGNVEINFKGEEE